MSRPLAALEVARNEPDHAFSSVGPSRSTSSQPGRPRRTFEEPKCLHDGFDHRLWLRGRSDGGQDLARQQSGRDTGCLPVMSRRTSASASSIPSSSSAAISRRAWRAASRSSSSSLSSQVRAGAAAAWTGGLAASLCARLLVRDGPLVLSDPSGQRRRGRRLVAQRLGRGFRGVERVERTDGPRQTELVVLLLVGDEPARRTLGLDREPLVGGLIDAGFGPLPRRDRLGLRGSGFRAHPGTAAGSSRRSRMPRYAFHGPTSASYEPASPA